MAIKRKTKLMLEVEEKHGLLEETIPRLVNQLGKGVTAETLGISKATLDTWMLKLGLEFERRVVTVGGGPTEEE